MNVFDIEQNTLYRHLRHIRTIAASCVCAELAMLMSETSPSCAAHTVHISLYLFVYAHIPTYASYLTGNLGKDCSLIFSSESI